MVDRRLARCAAALSLLLFLAACAAQPQPLPESEAEVCGAGIVKAGSAAATGLAARYGDAADRLLLDHLAAMRTSADPLTRAAAHVALREASALAEMALRSDDPTIYTFALQACTVESARPTAAAATCALLTTGQLARLDPDNAVSWLRVAHAAASRHDADGADAAMQRASQARRIEWREERFEALALAAIADSTPPLDKGVLGIGIVGIRAAFAQPTYQTLSQHCAPAPMADPNRRATCDALARLLVERSPSLLGVQIGQRLGTHAGWTEAQVEVVAARVHAYHQLYADATRSVPSREHSCDTIERQLGLRREMAPTSERAVLDARFLDRGWSQDTLVERYRAHRAAR